MRSDRRFLQLVGASAICLSMTTVAIGQSVSRARAEVDSDAGSNLSAGHDDRAGERLQLAVRAVHFAMVKAAERLAEDRYRDAINMAYAGMDGIDALPPSVNKRSIRQPFVQIILDARTEQDGGPDAGPKWRSGGEHHSQMNEVATVLLGLTATASEPEPGNPPPVEQPDGRRADRSEDDRRLRRSAAAQRGYKADEADELVQVAEARRIPKREMNYSSDWQAKRTGDDADRLGVMFEGPAFRNEEGAVRQTVVYDIRSLLMPSFEFNYIPSYDLRSSNRNSQDRDALRRGSEIFNGYPRDLAQGLPLLNFFGGVGDWPGVIGDGDQEYDHLLDLIDALTEPPTGP